MTVQDIIDDARPLLGDTVSPYQFLDAHFYDPINKGVRSLATSQPHSLYVTTVTTDLPADVTAVGDTVLIIDEMRNTLVGLVVAHLQAEASPVQGEPTT